MMNTVSFPLLVFFFNHVNNTKAPSLQTYNSNSPKQRRDMILFHGPPGQPRHSPKLPGSVEISWFFFSQREMNVFWGSVFFMISWLCVNVGSLEIRPYCISGMGLWKKKSRTRFMSEFGKHCWLVYEASAQEWVGRKARFYRESNVRATSWTHWDVKSGEIALSISLRCQAMVTN